MKNNLLTLLMLSLCLTLAFTSCKKDDDEPGIQPDNAFVSKTPQHSNVLIEELTGVRCGYCPAGHKIIDSIMAKYPEHVFSINVHCGSYAQGQPNYSCQEGETLLRNLGTKAFPTGYVNRYAYNAGYGVFAVSRSDYMALSEAIMQTCQAYANIAAKATINKATREMTVQVQVYFTDTTSKTPLLQLAIIQNDILGPQNGAKQFYPEKWDDVNKVYEHNHMLRAYITPVEGKEIEYKGKNTLYSETFKYTVPEKFGEIKAELEDLEVIAFVSNKAYGSDGSTFGLPVINVCKAQ